ncbi:MAG: hypothetical protein KTR31_04275 [Myxococcales bacterium]|nr:hypothetical protein [Myxococcales bacterium]
MECLMRQCLPTVFLASCALLAGCTEPVDCTTEAVTSVRVDVVDVDGERVRQSEATYSVDGGEPMPCEELVEGAFECGVEVEGDFTITATARGYIDAVTEVTVESDECHVIPVELDLLIEVDECQQDFRPGVLVGVTDGKGAVPADTAVFWTSDLVWDPCIGPDAKGLWACAEEVAGLLTVEASATGFATATQDVTVETDGCHVTTERLDFVMVAK